MRLKVSIPLLAVTTIALSLALGCSKDPEEAEKFPRAGEGGLSADFSEVRQVELDNGITVFLQEEMTDERVAIEVFYRAGFYLDPAGKIQLAHVSEHAVVQAATASYQPGESLSMLTKRGRVNAEAIAEFVHFDYIVDRNQLEDALKVEFERLTSITFHDDVIEAERTKSAAEIDRAIASRVTLVKFALMVVNQVANHGGGTAIPIEEETEKLTAADVQAFHAEYYRADDMIISIIGAIDLDEAEALVRRIFSQAPQKPEPTMPVFGEIERTTNIEWGVDRSAGVLMFPGPYADDKERLCLTLFGGYIGPAIRSHEDMVPRIDNTYGTNPVYPAGVVPFFIYIQPNIERNYSDAKILALQITDQAMSTIDERRLEGIKARARQFIESTLIREGAIHTQMQHHQVIGQEALNLGLKHIYKEGKTNEEFFALIDSITLEDMQNTLNKYITAENMREFILR